MFSFIRDVVVMVSPHSKRNPNTDDNIIRKEIKAHTKSIIKKIFKEMQI